MKSISSSLAICILTFKCALFLHLKKVLNSTFNQLSLFLNHMELYRNQIKAMSTFNLPVGGNGGAPFSGYAGDGLLSHEEFD